MKHIVKPRQYGKSTLLLEEAFKENNAIIVGFNQTVCRRVLIPIMIKILEKNNIPYDFKISTLEIVTADKKFRFISALTFIDEKKSITPVFIDEAGYILKDLFGNVKCINSTGPNAKTNSKLHEKVQECLPDLGLSDEALLSEFTLEWNNEKA